MTGSFFQHLLWKTKAYRPWIQRAVAVGGGTLVTGAFVFPHLEDSYWHHHHTNTNTNNTNNPNKKKLVILGTGWASVSVLQHINRDLYDITLISPRNYFLFTPLLPSVCSGTVTEDAVTIPIRDLTSYKNLSLKTRLEYLWRGFLPDPVRYLLATASDIRLEERVVHCNTSGSGGVESTTPNHNQDSLKVPYDVLVVATGATTNTFDTQGVPEHCHYLKETGDATMIRQAVLERLEKASLPSSVVSCDTNSSSTTTTTTTTEEEELERKRRQLLSFWVVGGGPTAVEFAAELQDFLQHDLVDAHAAAYRQCRGLASVTLVQSNSDVLPGYPKKIRDFSLQHMRKNGIQVKTESRATKVTRDSISIYDKATKTTKDFTYGLIVWATGVAPGPLIRTLISQIPEQQSYRTLKTDALCRVIGTNNNNNNNNNNSVFALGDCADIDVLATEHNEIARLYDDLQHKFPTTGSTEESADETQSLSQKANEVFVKELEQRLSTSVSAPGAKIVQQLKESLDKAKNDDSGPFQGLTKDELEKVVRDQMKRQKFLPPTAQVAHQQGKYLANVLNNPQIDESTGTWSFDHAKGFEFQNLGQLCYVGGHMAALSVPVGSGPTGNQIEVSWNGNLTNYVWHAAYFGMMESWRSRAELIFDWSKSSVFGRSTALEAVCSTNSESARRVDSLQRSEGKPVVDAKKDTRWWRFFF